MELVSAEPASVDIDEEPQFVTAEHFKLAKRALDVQPGQPQNCNLWFLVRKKDTCNSIVNIAKYFSIKLTQVTLLQHNPALKNECSSLQPSYYVCVATKSSSSTSAPAPTKTSSSTLTSETMINALPTNFAIVGAKGGCANRQNIEVMIRDQPDVFNLLILALDKMYQKNMTDPWSWYQVAGVHGYPLNPWPDPKAVPGKVSSTAGYCPHGSGQIGSPIFTTWHRPYMLMLEQVIVSLGEEIAHQFTDANKEKYVAASKLLRWPYWDWVNSDTQSHTPAIVKQPKIDVTTPSGKKNIDNPLYSYKFKAKESETVFRPGSDFIGTNFTTRGDQIKGNFKTYEDRVDKRIQSDFPTSRVTLYQNLMSEIGFNEFSNALEMGIHGRLHNYLGGSFDGIRGFSIMKSLGYAAFDPIFWLHHNNIDRMMAMWQAANPTLKMRPGKKVDTYQNPGATGNDDLNTPLYPFKHPDGSYWTSDDVSDVQSIWKYGYGYPEVPCDRVTMDSASLDVFTTSRINALYKENVAPKRRFIKRAADSRMVMWDANIVVDRAEFIGSWGISFFIGNSTPSDGQWSSSDNYAGSISYLGMDGVQAMSGVVSNTVPLNPILKAKGILRRSQSQIDDYLAKNLFWKAWDDHGVKDLSSMKTLKVGVTNNQMIVPGDNKKKATFGAARLRTKVTKNRKAGGVKNPSELLNPVDKTGKKVALAVSGPINKIATPSTETAAPPPAPVPVIASQSTNAARAKNRLMMKVRSWLGI
ncbi:hypothetical protein H072_7203 [Dactylellina haptotyla CBS 200.50]|uniref:tyrosinase n=1 Tax=Dactylellina haptotyla (strain CBS 200.50) TaxID=1284197 RepID=S8BUN8_DACHA|nr:hypothetical protein H072_7203 [Dactylellina haptotyla CBS 200.50]